MSIRRIRGILVWLVLLAPLWAYAQDFEFHPPATAADPATPGVMRDLAGRVLPVYQEDDRELYLANLSMLQLVAGNFVAADQTRAELRERRRNADLKRTPGRPAMLDLYTRAKAARESDHVPFPQAFAQAYRDVVPKLNNFDAYALTTLMGASFAPQQAALQKGFDRHRAKGSVTLDEAVELLSTYLDFDVKRTLAPLLAQLDAEDEKQRYTDDAPVLIPNPHGPQLSVLVVRPKNGPQTLPTLFEFTNDPSVNYARECAAHGYIGVVAYARGIGESHGQPLPFQRDGEDARAVIAWIIQQPWSDGRVGMYGSGYSGFAAWAAAKKLPPALKAIATADPMAPGVDFPMTGGVFRNEALRWAYQLTDLISEARRAQSGRGAARPTAPPDDAAWRATDEAWYRSGKPYRDLRAPGHKYVQIFTRWLNHPSYDRFWQEMVPFQREFAQLNIPVLTMSGYYAAGEPGAIWYFAQHLRYNPQADHRLFIGPYDDTAIRHSAPPALNGLAIDANAQLNLRELRYQWFDSIFRGGRRPPLLQERINFQVPGTNEWRHVAAEDAVASGSLRYFLDAAADPKSSDEPHRLATLKPAAALAATQVVSFTDRSDAAWVPATDLVAKGIQPHNGIAFVSEPLAKPVEIAGFISGHLDLKVNRMDVDLALEAYELTPGGDYVKLFDPAFEFRASYQKDRIHRNLLPAGVRKELAFRSERMASRRLQAGSRIVAVFNVMKRADREINYGQGDDVSEESMEDARIPLKLRWYSDSTIEFPVREIPPPVTRKGPRQNSSK